VNSAESTDRTLCLVSGYHQHSYPPTRAYFNGLLYRFAVVFDTYRCSKADEYFDSELFLLLVPRLCEIIGYEAIELVMPEAAKHLKGIRFNSFQNLSTFYRQQDELECQPPEWIELTKKNQLIGLGNTEFWNLLGGPDPYHDSYTVSLYTAQDRSEEFRKACELDCPKLGALITNYYVEQQLKEPYRSIGTRILRWFRWGRKGIRTVF